MMSRKTRRLIRRLEAQERFDATLLGKVCRKLDFAVAIVFFVIGTIIRSAKKTARRTDNWLDEHMETIVGISIVLIILYLIPFSAMWIVESMFGGL